jgi:hypothetical protein
MEQTQRQEEPAAVRLGHVDIADRRAVVMWPGNGDGVAIDFPDAGSRFGIVADLDRDPRLRVEPRHATLVDLEGRMAILETVAALWIRHTIASVPAALRKEMAR